MHIFMIELPNNRLIINGHRIVDLKQFYAYLTKKFKMLINKQEDLKILNEYKDLKIAIRHAWNFLEEETTAKHDTIIKELSKYWEIKQTWLNNLKLQRL